MYLLKSRKDSKKVTDISFKDVMSAVPTSVSLISCIEGDAIYGCTISSLVSLDISNESPIVAFMLKKDSLVGKKITSNKLFSINVLSAGQEDLAKYYSSERTPDFIKDNKWKLIGNVFPNKENVKVVLNCEYHDIFQDYPANIFVAKVIESSVNNRLFPLIYESRKFINLMK